MIFAARTLLAAFAVASASATELRGNNDRVLAAERSSTPGQCKRNHKTLYFDDSVAPSGTIIEMKEKATSNKRQITLSQEEDGSTSLSNSDKNWLNAFHSEDYGGVLQIRWCFPGETFSHWRECSENTPIGLDIDGSGAVERIQGDFMFDISGDGDIEHLHEWFAPTEGILVDAALAMKDGLVSSEHFVSSSSTIDNRELTKHSGAVTGKHLFGDMGSLFADGFQKLELKDIDNNGYVNGSELGGIAIWVDGNSNAKVDAGELNSLLSYGIVGLRTTPNSGTYVSEAQLSNGKTMIVEDLFFS